MRPADETDPLYLAMLNDGIILPDPEELQADPPSRIRLVVIGAGLSFMALACFFGVWMGRG